MEYRRCFKKNNCNYFVAEKIFGPDNKAYLHCLDSCPDEFPSRLSNGLCVTCDVQLNKTSAYWNGTSCVTCAYENPRYPVLRDGTCIRCEEAYPDRPYWNTTDCVTEMPRKQHYISGVSLILAAFIAISVLKFLQFWSRPGRKQFTACGVVYVVLAFLCVASVAALVCVIAFVDASTKIFYVLLSVIGVCVVIGACSTACIACRGPELVKFDNILEYGDEDKSDPDLIGDIIERGRKGKQLFRTPQIDVCAKNLMYSGTCCQCCVSQYTEPKPRNLYKHFSGAVVASFVIKTIGIIVSLVFAAADVVQLLGQFVDLPDTWLNRFLELLGSDTGGWKVVAVLACIFCNVLFSDQFVTIFLDRGKSAWEVVGLQLLYFIVENIDNYAALCLGNISQELWEYNPLFAIIVGLMFGQLYASDLWVAGKNVFWVTVVICRNIRDGARNCVSACTEEENKSKKDDSDSCCFIAFAIFIYLCAIAIGFLVVIAGFIILVGQIIPPIIDVFALPIFFF